MSTLPPAFVYVLHLRGFAWADEFRPDPAKTGTLPILGPSGAPVGAADLSLPPDTPDDTFSLFDKIAPLTDRQRSNTLAQLERAELELLVSVLPALDDSARRHILSQLDEDDSASFISFDDPAQSLAVLTRKERSEVLALLRSAAHVGLIESATVLLLRDALSEIQALRDQVFRDSIRLAASTIGSYRGLLDWSTALLAACQGLEIALDRFEPSRGNQFSTYAVHWIRHRVGRHRSNQQAPLRLPVHIGEALYHYVATERTLWTDDGRPSTEAVLEALGDQRQRIENKVEHLRPVFDAHLFHGHSSLTPFGEQIVDPDLPSMWDGAAPSTWPARALEQVEHALSTLGGRDAERKAEILRERLALRRPGRPTLEELGKTYGVSRERIRQVQAKAIGRLRLGNLYGEADIRPWLWRSGS